MTENDVWLMWASWSLAADEEQISKWRRCQAKRVKCTEGSGQSLGPGPRRSFHCCWLLRRLCKSSHDAWWAPTVNLELSTCQRTRYKSHRLCFTTDDASGSFMRVCARAYKVLRYQCNSLWAAIQHRQQKQNIEFKNKRDTEVCLLNFYSNPTQCQMSSHR